MELERRATGHMATCVCNLKIVLTQFRRCIPNMTLFGYLTTAVAMIVEEKMGCQSET